jgi:hypothetical protein
MRGDSIDYDAIRSKYSTVEYDALASKLRRALPGYWKKAYRKMVDGPTHVLRHADRRIELLFDHVSELLDRGEIPANQVVEDRVVVAFGRTPVQCPRRDDPPIHGLLGRAATALGGGTIRDHGIGGPLGIPLNVCLFPQHRDLGREWSGDGRTYRAMERYCSENPGTFTFTRLIYDTPSWWPCEIEYGLLRRDGLFWVSRFENVAQPTLRAALPAAWRTQVTAP